VSITVNSMKLRVLLIFPAMAIIGLMAQFGCNSTGPTKPSAPDYYISATLIQDPNVDSTWMVVRLQKENADYDSATVKFGSVTLNYSNLQYGFDSIYYLNQDTSPVFAAGVRDLVLDDSPDFADTVSISVGSPFYDSIASPNNHIFRPSDPSLVINWQASANAQTYVLAAVLADSAYRGYGYSEYGVSLGTSGSLPQDAFMVSPGNNFDTGLYNVYVYAIVGVPDSTLTSRLLPVPLPSQFPTNNINTGDLVGRIGTIQVSLMDTIRATTIP